MNTNKTSTRSQGTRKIWKITSKEFPFFMERIPNPPEALWVWAREEMSLELLEHLPKQGWTIVGTRRPQERSLRLVDRSVRAASGSNSVILSGLALGVDERAHRSAISAELPTIAVVASSLDKIYPQENEELAMEIVECGGLVISEKPQGQKMYPSDFLHRNRILAASARRVWVVEAAYQSGAMNTAKWVREVGDLCYATPSFPGDPAFSGNQLLLENGLAEPYWGQAQSH